MNPPLRTLSWRIPGLVAWVSLLALVEVNLINAIPQHEHMIRSLGGGALVYLMMLFLPWVRWHR
jgi:hypothetical protein